MEDQYGSGVGSPGRWRIDDVLERTDLGRLLDELASTGASRSVVSVPGATLIWRGRPSSSSTSTVKV